MTVTETTFDPHLVGLDAADWLEALEDVADEFGYFEPLGRGLSALFIDRGPQLIVTFETRSAIPRLSPRSEPLGFHFVRNDGWSHLCILSDETSAFRSPRLFRMFDNLVDEGFFDRFDDVLFMGEHLAGYAAAAFSVTSPGARALLFRPIATLASDYAGWDTRHQSLRTLDFTSRYGYAPAMIEAAEQVHVVFDPVDRPDAMHAALFVAPNVRLHRARYFGIELLQRFTEGRIHADIVRAAMAGRLGHADFGALLRPLRWTLPARIVRMLQVMRARADADRTIRYCEIIRARKKVPQVETMYNQLTAAKGQKKPAE